MVELSLLITSQYLFFSPLAAPITKKILIILQGTGRGFGLDRKTMLEQYKLYFDSHFNNAIVLLLACLVCILSSHMALVFLIFDSTLISLCLVKIAPLFSCVWRVFF